MRMQKYKVCPTTLSPSLLLYPSVTIFPPLISPRAAWTWSQEAARLQRELRKTQKVLQKQQEKDQHSSEAQKLIQYGVLLTLTLPPSSPPPSSMCITSFLCSPPSPLISA